MITDHCNLRTFLTTKNLSRREARWWERLSSLDLVIKYRPGRYNPADGLSRRPDYAGNKPNLSHQVGTVVSSEAGEPLGIQQGTEKLEEKFETKKWVVASITGIRVTAPRGNFMEWEPTIDSTIVN